MTTIRIAGELKPFWIAKNNFLSIPSHLQKETPHRWSTYGKPMAAKDLAGNHVALFGAAYGLGLESALLKAKRGLAINPRSLLCFFLSYQTSYPLISYEK
jgi:hypothetical protein